MIDIKEGDVLFYIGGFTHMNRFSIDDKCVVDVLGPLYESGRRKVTIKNIKNDRTVSMNITMLDKYFITLSDHRRKFLSDLI